MGWLLSHATGLNLGISITQFGIGIAIGFWWKPELLTKGKSAEWAFGFWTMQWFVFAATYLVILRYPSHEGILLLLLDVQSLLILASASTLLLGEPLKLARILIILGLLCCVFGFYNLALDPWDTATTIPPLRDLLRWSLPSQTLSILALNWIGFVACLRYGRYALPFVLVAVAYGTCQQALYSATVLRYQDVSHSLVESAPWYLAAAAGKLLFGACFYGLTYLRLPAYSSLFPSYEPQDRKESLGTLGKVASRTASLIIVPLAVNLFAAWLFSLFRK